MYLTVIAWVYVVLMMSVAEATSPAGTLLGAVMTFLLYGVLPLSIVVYLMRTPARRRAIKARDAQATQETQAPNQQQANSVPPDAGSEPAAGSTGGGTSSASHAAVREKA